jgi:hypothetical protein
MVWASTSLSRLIRMAGAGSHDRAAYGQQDRVNSAHDDPANLEQLIRQELTNAGFTVEPPRLPGGNGPPADGGLVVRHEPGRGVVVSWEVSPDLALADVVKYETIRTAVQLALRTILAHAGFRVVADFDGSKMLVIARPQESPPEQDRPNGTVSEQDCPSGTAAREGQPSGTVSGQDCPSGTVSGEGRSSGTSLGRDQPSGSARRQGRSSGTVSE